MKIKRIHTLYILIFHFLIGNNITQAQTRNINDLLAIYSTENNNSALVKEIVGNLERMAANSPKEALVYVDKFENLAKKKKDNLGYGLLQKAKAFANYNLGDFNKSIAIIDKALKDIPQDIHLKISAQLNVVKATSLYFQNRYPQALDVFQIAEKQALKQNDEITLYLIKNNLAGINLVLNDLEKAEYYLVQTLNYYLKQQNKVAAAYCYNNLGIIEDKRSNLDKTLLYFMNAKKIMENENYGIFKAQVYNNIGSIYNKLNKVDSSQFYLENALAMNTKIGNMKGVATNKTGLSETFFKKGDYESSKNMALDAYQKGKDLNILNIMQESSDQLFKTYVKLGDSDSALFYHQLSKSHADSIGNSDNTRKLTKLEMNYEFEKKEEKYKHQQTVSALEIQRQLLENQLKQSLLDKSLQEQSIQQSRLEYQNLLNKENQQKLALAQQDKKITLEKNKSLLQKNELADLRMKQLWLYGVLIILGLAILSYIWWNKNRIQKIRFEKELKEKETQELKQRHRTTESELKAIRSQMNPHFIYNVLNSIEAYIVEQDAHHASLLIQKFSMLSRMILENSTQSLANLASEWKINKLYLEIEQIRFNHGFQFQINNHGVELENYLIPPMMIQPLIENAIHHGIRNSVEKDLLIILSCAIQDNQLKIEIEDNGTGLKPKQNNLHPYKKQSFGTKSVSERIQILNEQYHTVNNATFTLENLSNHGKRGCLATIRLPILYSDQSLLSS